jgi:hypothetical protein
MLQLDLGPNGAKLVVHIHLNWTVSIDFIDPSSHGIFSTNFQSDTWFPDGVQ